MRPFNVGGGELKKSCETIDLVFSFPDVRSFFGFHDIYSSSIWSGLSAVITVPLRSLRFEIKSVSVGIYIDEFLLFIDDSLDHALELMVSAHEINILNDLIG